VQPARAALILQKNWEDRPLAGLFCCKSALQALHSKGLGAIGNGKTWALLSQPRLKKTVVSNQHERGGNMNKNELVAAVADKAGLSKADASSAVDAVFETIQGELKNGGDIRLVGFGNFSVSRREASKGRNPSTGAEVDIPARNVPKFTAGKGLKDAVN
jgi:DNA-binding protein HU-beta